MTPGAPVDGRAPADSLARADSLAPGAVPAAAPDTVPAAAPDTVRAAPATARKAAGEEGFFSSPTGIMLRSLVVPGWGQATNGSWIKAGVAVAAEGLLIAAIVRDSGELKDLTPGTPQYDAVYNRRQQEAWWLGAVVFLSMIDAYVDAHLKSGDVELGPEPRPDGLSLAARVRWR